MDADKCCIANFVLLDDTDGDTILDDGDDSDLPGDNHGVVTVDTHGSGFLNPPPQGRRPKTHTVPKTERPLTWRAAASLGGPFRI